jgi:hypothetical protein
MSAYGERRGVYGIFVKNPEGKRPLERHRNILERNIIMESQEVLCGVYNGLMWLKVGTSGEQL